MKKDYKKSLKSLMEAVREFIDVEDDLRERGGCDAEIHDQAYKRMKRAYKKALL